MLLMTSAIAEPYNKGGGEGRIYGVEGLEMTYTQLFLEPPSYLTKRRTHSLSSEPGCFIVFPELSWIVCFPK
jgi:hypothetical protein